MLQRIYGTVWNTQEELDLYLWRREEARKRDHRRLGVALDLFSFHDVSPGSAFWHPKGQRLWRTLEGAMRELQERRGYQEVSTPILVHKKLWEQSGHWDMYGENMFRVESEGQTFSLKPMNCPESTFIYTSRVRSYRDLPLRFNEYGRLHRNERSGALSGLTRVRQFIQDDAHIYVRPDQLGDEIQALLGEVAEATPGSAWAPLRVRDAARQGAGRPGGLGARRGAHQGGAGHGRRELRGQAQGRHLLRAQDRHLHRRRPGPRMADGHHPGGPDDAARALRPALHRRGRASRSGRSPSTAPSTARWSASSASSWSTSRARSRSGARPVQAVVVPIADRHNEAAGELAGVLARARHPGRGRRLARTGCRTRSALAQEQKVPYMLVLGDREIEARTAAARTRAGEQQPAARLGGAGRPARGRGRRSRP